MNREAYLPECEEIKNLRLRMVFVVGFKEFLKSE